MSLSSLQSQLLPQIEQYLQTFLDAQDFHDTEDLKQMLVEHMGWEDSGGGRGKRIRPLLVLLCAGGFGAPVENALPGAAAVELLHNFTLIHDDIEDQSPLRHGRPTLWTRWGTAQAINAGDALFSIAQIAMLGLSETHDTQTAHRATLAFNRVCLHLTRGQHLDIALENQSGAEVDTYLAMIRGKTAALIAHSAWLGGLSANQDSGNLEKLSAFGESLGMAFQIQDDELGIWGDPGITGKSAASDLLTRKTTLPVLYGLEHCPEFREIWHSDGLTAEDIETMSELLRACGAQKETRVKAEYYTKQAFSSLESLYPHKNNFVNAVFDLAQGLLARQA